MWLVWLWLWLGDGRNDVEELVGLAIVVLRGRDAVVGAEGGGGREIERSEVEGRRVARQRKHSPVP